VDVLLEDVEAVRVRLEELEAVEVEVRLEVVEAVEVFEEDGEGVSLGTSTLELVLLKRERVARGEDVGRSPEGLAEGVWVTEGVERRMGDGVDQSAGDGEGWREGVGLSVRLFVTVLVVTGVKVELFTDQLTVGEVVAVCVVDLE